MLALIPATAFAIVSLWPIARASRAVRDPVPPVLAALPCVLLLVVLPVPVGSIQSIRAFQAIGESGGSLEPTRIRAFAISMLAPSWCGALAALLTLGVAGLLTWRRRRPAAGADEAELGTRPVRRPAGWMAACSMALIVPSAALLVFAGSVAPLLVGVLDVCGSDGVVPPAGMTLGEVSAAISSRLIVGVLGGVVVAALGVLAGVINLALLGRLRSSAGLERAAWFAGAVVALLLLAYLVVVGNQWSLYQGAGVAEAYAAL